MPYSARSITHYSQISSYSRLLRRVNQTLSASIARQQSRAKLLPQPDDITEDWERLVDELSQNEDLCISKNIDGAVIVRWTEINRSAK